MYSYFSLSVQFAGYLVIHLSVDKCSQGLLQNTGKDKWLIRHWLLLFPSLIRGVTFHSLLLQKTERPSFSEFLIAGYHTKNVVPKINLYYISKEACKSILSNFLYILVFHPLHILIHQKWRGNIGILLESKKSVLIKYNCSKMSE